MLLSGLVIIAVIRPRQTLYDFDQKATLPLRAILATFIVFHHVSLQSVTEHPVDYLSPFFHFKSMGTPVVTVFFFLTGYGLAQSLKRKGNSYLIKFVPKRLGKILPEFITLTICYIIFIIAETKTPRLITDQMMQGNPPLPFSWFMYAITYVYLAFFISAKISKSNILKTGAWLSVFFIVYTLFINKLHWAAWWWTSIFGTFFGYYTAAYEEKISKILFNRYILGLTAIFAITSVFVSIMGINLIRFQLIALLTYLCIRLYGCPSYRLLTVIGGISLNIYLIHGVILFSVKDYFENSYILLIVVLSLSCIGAYALKVLRQHITKSNIFNFKSPSSAKP